MRIRPVAPIPLGRGENIELPAGGYHIMLMDFRLALVPGERMPIIPALHAPTPARVDR